MFIMHHVRITPFAIMLLSTFGNKEHGIPCVDLLFLGGVFLLGDFDLSLFGSLFSGCPVCSLCSLNQPC